MTIPPPFRWAGPSSAPARFRPFVAVCAFAGFRLGEARRCGWRTSTSCAGPSPSPARCRGRLTTAEVVPPKYGSERVVYIPAELVTLLAEHVRRTGVQHGQWLVRERSACR